MTNLDKASEALYDRQIRVWGANSQQMYSKDSFILIHRLLLPVID
jgi:molybdopterin/thiamine biosynthesis adenylyltransferase